MPKATEERRKQYGRALARAMSETGIEGRIDEWLGSQVGLSSQAIRNYVAGVREPKSEAIVLAIELALGKEPYSLGAILGYGPTDDERISSLEREIRAQRADLDRLVTQVERLLSQAGRSKR